MNSVERVRSICKERKIAISKLEKDLGFSNGYIGQLRKGSFPADRLAAIAEYLSVTTDYLLYGDKKTPVPKKDERDGSEIMFALSRGGEQEITDEMFDEVKRFAAYIAQREKDKK